MTFEYDPQTPAHGLAVDCLEAGIDAAAPARGIERHVSLEAETLHVREAEYDLSAYEEILVLGGGKAADGLAAGLERILGDRVDGVVVTDERTADLRRIEVLLGEHPTPGEGSVAGATAVLDAAAAAGEKTLVLAVITGGGSALLCAPREGLDAADVRAVTDGLLSAGASIDEVNTVRRAISDIKGGGLAAAAAPATVVGLLVSDVVGDDPAVIASGPTTPVGADPEAAVDVLEHYEVDVPAIREHLDGREPTQPADVDVENHVIASGRDAIDAACEVAREADYTPCVLSTQLEGESSDAGRFHAAVAAEVLASGRPLQAPAVLLSGGETTVTVTGSGLGGPNTEFVLGAGVDLPEGAVVAAVDTDGSDGSTDAAGAITDRLTDLTAAQEALSDNDSYRFFEKRDAILRSGLTGTNVDDLRVVVVPDR